MRSTIEGILDDLILKYNIDRYHRRYAIMKAAKDLLINLFNQIELDGLLLVSEKQVDIEIIKDHVRKLIDTDFIIIDFDKIDDYKQKQLMDCKHAVIISFQWHREIFTEIKRSNTEVISIYNYFLENGLEINYSYYDIFGHEFHTFHGEKSKLYDDFDMNSIIFYDRKCYQLEKSKALKKIYLGKLIFNCIYIKDFLSAKKYIKEYISNGFDNNDSYKFFNEELDHLLFDIKNKMLQNNKRHIIMYWLDALEYGEEKDMPFFNKISDQGIKFENAYTVTPYTHFTIKTIFLKKNPVDDKSYNIKTVTKENSEVIKFLIDNGYDFKYYGFSKQFDDKLKDKSYINRYTTASTIYWNMLTNLVSDDSDKLTFSLLHEVMETHSPFVSPAIDSEKYLFKEFTDIEEIEYRNKNYAPISRKYIDEQLQFYTDLIGESTCNIFMSDHGHTVYGRYHTILNITGNGINHRKYNRLFSYYNFDDLIRFIVKLDEDILTNIFSDYVKIQDVDYYNKKAILKSMSKEKFGGLGALGYRGIITQTDMMICYNNGHKEYFQLNKNGIIKEERLIYLEKLIGDNKIDIYQDDYFKYSRYVYKILENYQKRVGKLLEKKIDMICKMIDEIPEDKIIAIRCGGENTRKLFWSIGYNRRNRFSYIIDKDKECTSSKLGIPVIFPEEMETKEIDVVIVSCFPMISTIKKEMGHLSTKYNLLDMYEYINKNGISTETEFYRETYADSDFEFIMENNYENI